MSAPDDKAEGFERTEGALAERASGPESDVVAMKRYGLVGVQVGGRLESCSLIEQRDGPCVKFADADREIGKLLALIATERRENSEAIAARDARIAQLEEREMSSADLRQRITTLTERLASRDEQALGLRRDLAERDAELAEARELLQEAYEDGQLWRGERIYGHIRPDSKLTCPMQPNVPAEPSGGESNG